ncbi:MAG: hypothetical protein HKN46_03025, partial [Acidimicrobiia bacterium]|nr:hypothetical protein [Acidimicrobiia bacterium]
TLDPSDADESSYFGLTPGVVTNSSLCDFGDTFRLLFTPDMQRYSSSTPFYKLSDSNPGQFFYNVFYVNDGTTDTVSLEIPYPYVTQGAMPVHVYGGLTVDPVGDGTDINCFQPNEPGIAYGSTFGLGDYTDTNGDGVVGFGDVFVVNVLAEDSFQYINIHLDYGLEKTKDWERKGESVVNDGTNDEALGGIRIDPGTALAFRALADGIEIAGSTDSVSSVHEFKQIRGFGGLVFTAGGEPVEGATVRLLSSDGAVLETMTTDADGWYLSVRQHKGKAATYWLELLDGDGNVVHTESVTVGGKVKFGGAEFTVE